MISMRYRQTSVSKLALRATTIIAGLSAGLSLPATAGDLTISDTETSPVSTLAGDGAGPGNITIEAGGGVELDTGTPVTLNSDNSVTNAGVIEVLDEQDTTAILIDGSAGNLNGSVTNSGVISVPGPEDNSPVFNTPVENAGIRLAGPGSLTGSIVNGSGADIQVGGNASYGLFLDSDITGDIVNQGRIATSGIESVPISITGNLTGDITNDGTITASGRDTIGLYLGGSMTGTITHNGSITSGRSAQRDFQDGSIIPELGGEAAIWIAGSVGGGLQVTGNRVTADLEPDLDADDPARDIVDAQIQVIGPGNILRVRPGGPGGTLSNINIGAVGTGNNAYGILNQGLMSVGANREGVPVEGVIIEGLVSGSTIYATTIAGGLHNDGGDIRAGTIDAEATAIRIGNYATVPEIRNSGDILAATNDSTEDLDDGIIGENGGDAYAVLVQEQGSISSVVNTGVIEANAAGSGSSAYAIIDRSGSLTFSNTGDVLAEIRDGASGETIALDVRSSVDDITFFNSGTMTGDVYLGDGSDTFTSTGGSITGTLISLGAGDDTVTLANTSVTGRIAFTTGTKSVSLTDSTLVGGITETGAIIDMTVSNADWTIGADAAANLRTIDIQGGTTLRIEVDGVNNQAGTLRATNAAFLASDTVIVPVLRSFISEQQTFTLVEASQLTANLTFDEEAVAATSYMHTIAVVDDTPNNRILLNVRRRTADELGLSANRGVLFENAGAAFSQDSALFTRLAAITEQDPFEDALLQFLPNTSNAVIQSAIDQQNMALGAINRRLDRVPARGFYRNRASVWIQPMGHYAKRKTDGEQLGYSTWSGGIAIGFDRNAGLNTRAGLAFTQLWSFPDLLDSGDEPMEYSSSQLNGYIRTGNTIRHLQGSFTLGYDNMNTEREVAFGSLNRRVLGDTDGYQFGSSVQLALGTMRGTWSLVPMASLKYLYLHQGGYIETGGGDGLNLAFESDNTDSLRASLGFATRKQFYRDDRSTTLEFEGRASYTREFMTGMRDVGVAFAAGGTPFVLEGLPLTQDVLSIGGGFFYKNDHATVSLDYDAEKASKYLAHTAAVTIRFRF
jgi:uncharacterized protein with beta-barrel porin domain